jgi:hypothetical protein
VGHAFQPGQRLNVFVDVRNTGTKAQGNMYSTALKCSIVIRDSNNVEWFKRNFFAEEIPLRNPVPCYNWPLCFFFWPEAMPPGVHTLTVTVTDESISPHAMATQSLTFKCGPPAQ